MDIISRLAGRVLHLRIDGTISQTMVTRVQAGIRSAWYTPAQAIFVSIQSQGGSLTQSRNIVDILRNYAQRKNVPIYCFAEDQCLGSANLILTSGVKCYASSLSLLGDFGYNWTTFNLKNWAEKNQVKEQEVVGGKLEPSYSFFKDLSPEAEKFTVDQLKSLANNLQQDIRANRYQHILHKKSNDALQQNIFDRPIVYAQDMIANGLLDGVMTAGQVMREKFPEYKVKEIGKKHRFSEVSQAISFEL